MLVAGFAGEEQNALTDKSAIVTVEITSATVSSAAVMLAAKGDESECTPDGSFHFKVSFVNFSLFFLHFLIVVHTS